MVAFSHYFPVFLVCHLTVLHAVIDRFAFVSRIPRSNNFIRCIKEQRSYLAYLQGSLPPSGHQCPVQRLFWTSRSPYTLLYAFIPLNRFSYLVRPADTKCLIKLTTVLSLCKLTVSFCLPPLPLRPRRDTTDLTHTVLLSLYCVTRSHTILFWLYTLSSFIMIHTWFGRI